MASIHDQLQAYRAALLDAQGKGDQAIARQLEQRIWELAQDQQRPPEVTNAPYTNPDHLYVLLKRDIEA